jgi:acetylornithine deacetylase/succinyl-diaminopimelate desuccinylase-like protein
MGVKAGLNARQMCDIINAGSGRNSATQDKFPRSVLPGTFDYGFGMALMMKDVRLFLAEAEAAGTPVDHPFVQRVAEIAERTAGERPSITVRVGGTLPVVASLHRHLGMPGLSPPDNPWYSGSRAHAPNENIRLEDVGHAVRFTQALLHGLAKA